MRIVVCLKQVLDPATVRVSSRGELDMRDAAKIINPADLCALEEALKLKDAQGTEVVVVTLGGPEAEDILHEALAMGADRAVLLSDPLFAGSDAHGVSYALAQAVSAIGNVDLVLAGVRSTDDGGGQVGPHMAEHLSWPQITAALSLEVAGGRASALQRFEDGDRHTVISLPAVVTIAAASNQPRLASAPSIMNAYSADTVETMTSADIAADSARLGESGALTVIRRAFAPDPPVKSDVITGAPKEASSALVARLRRRGLI